MPYVHVDSRPVSVALVQMSCTEAKEPNVEKAIARIGEAAGLGANIVCLQELFTGPYFCQTEDHRHFAAAEPIPGPTSQALAALETINLSKAMGTVADEARGQRAMIHLMLDEVPPARDLADGIQLSRHQDVKSRAMLAAIVAEAWARRSTGLARA